ncbi:hypothetical protein KKC97_12275 [bacterium]|nr:hypothetical protein [bacterium]MBU1638432.1 hypothetical protein [bacterium]
MSRFRRMIAYLNPREMNKVGEEWKGLLTVLSSLLTFFTLLVALFGWVKAERSLSATETSLVREQFENKAVVGRNVMLVEAYNKDNLDAMRTNFHKYAGVPAAFDFGDSIAVGKRSTMTVSGTVKYPLDCPSYWLMFAQDNRVWPKVRLKNDGFEGKRIQRSVAVPDGFTRGRLLLVCVPDSLDGMFENWLAQGYDTPLLKPAETDLQIALTGQVLCHASNG